MDKIQIEISENELSLIATSLHTTIEEMLKVGIYKSYTNWIENSAVVSWTVEDIKNEMIYHGVILNDTEAFSLLQKYSDSLVEMMIADGWDTIKTCLFDDNVVMDTKIGIREWDTIYSTVTNNVGEHEISAWCSAIVEKIQMFWVYLNIDGKTHQIHVDNFKQWSKFIDIYEFCPHCDTEVILKNASFKTPQACPSCKNMILPCNLCDGMCINCDQKK